MGAITTQAQTAYRDYNVAGNPGSGVYQVTKSDVISLFTNVEASTAGTATSIAALSTSIALVTANQITDEALLAAHTASITSLQAGQAAGTVAFSTLALMNANLNYPAQTKGQVLADGTPANNGNYIKSGASGAGSWTYASALAVAANYNGTSTSSIAVGTGTKALTTQVGLAWGSGQRARFSSVTTPADWMEGIVQSYTSGVLTISADATSGSTATYASWNIGLAGQPGLQFPEADIVSF